MRLIRELEVDDVVFSYSDVKHEYVMHKASIVMAAGANFVLLGPDATMLEGHGADGCGHGGADRRREVPDDAGRRGRAEGRGQAGRRCASPDAVRGSRRAGRPAIRGARRPGPTQVHDRGARGVRTAHHQRHRDLCRRRLRRDPRAGAGGMRRPAVGRRQQRHAVLHAGCMDHAGRPASCGPRAHVSPGRDEPARRRRRVDQQDRFGDAGTGRAAGGDDRGGESRRHRRQGQFARDLRRSRARSRASASSSSRTARPSRTAR